MKSRDLALRWPRHENGVKTREPRRREPGLEAGRCRCASGEHEMKSRDPVLATA